jgi:hypothetical protein
MIYKMNMTITTLSIKDIDFKTAGSFIIYIIVYFFRGNQGSAGKPRFPPHPLPLNSPGLDLIKGGAGISLLILKTLVPLQGGILREPTVPLKRFKKLY